VRSSREWIRSLRPGDTASVFGYFALLTIIANVVTPSGALAQIPIQYFLKDHLHLGPSQSASFSLLVCIPLYGAFVFGMVRDQWSPFKLGDRGYFLLFGPIAALAYLSLAVRHDTYGQFLVGAFLILLVYRMIGPAVAGLTATVGQNLRMTGRLSSLLQLIGNCLGALLAYLAGWLQVRVSPETIFVMLAGASLCLWAFGLLAPRAIADATSERAAAKKDFLSDIKRLVTHRPLWPAVLIWLTWAFGPGQGTPLFFHLTKTVKLTPDQFGLYNSIGAVAFLPGLAAYGLLCKFVNPRKLILWSTVVAVPQMIPLTYISSVQGAYVTSAFVGIVGGMAYGAFYDLLLRSCPKGLEGTTLELGIAGAALVDRFGNLLGSHLYEAGGFALCNWITTAAYALMIPMLLLVPKETLAKRDAEL
jgi:MFS family permease